MFSLITLLVKADSLRISLVDGEFPRLSVFSWRYSDNLLLGELSRTRVLGKRRMLVSAFMFYFSRVLID